MRDLTKGSIASHLVVMAGPVAATLFTQMALQLVSLYFVTRIGDAATAGVSVAGTLLFIIAGLTQALDTGTAAIVAHATGCGDRMAAQRTCNQALVLSVVFAAGVTILLYTCGEWYLQQVASDPATVEAAVTYSYWAAPGFALLFPWSVLSAALRGTGAIRPTMVIYMLSVLVNAVLTPVLAEGWGPAPQLGVQGAGLAMTISTAFAVVVLAIYFERVDRFIGIDTKLMRPRLDQWRRILSIGLPAAAELVLTFLSTAVVYYAIRDFGPSAQAGYGIGSRLLQAVLAPAVAVALAAGPIAAQNVGAHDCRRVRQTFRQATTLVTMTMLAITALLFLQPQILVGVFEADAAAIAIAVLFLKLRALSFVAQGLVYTCSTMFQGLGNTVPPLLSSVMRFVAFVLSVLWLSARPSFRIEQIWYVWVVSVVLQSLVSSWLLAQEFRRRLPVCA